MAETSFSNIRVADEMGVADGEGYHLHFEWGAALSHVARTDGDHFALWLIGDERVAVFLYAAKEKRATIARARPASIGAVVFVDVVDAKTLDAEIEPADQPALCALAAAVAAYSAGELDGEPRRCVVRIAGKSHEVALGLDPDPQVDVWTGTVKSP
jgi:hypothetical protein